MRVSEAPSYGKPVLVYDLKCVGSEAYLRLATEIIQREKELRAAVEADAALAGASIASKTCRQSTCKSSMTASEHSGRRPWRTTQRDRDWGAGSPR